MNENIIFQGESKFEKIIFDKNSMLFYFYFEKIHLIPTGFWRFYKENKIVHISRDHTLKYHFQKPKIDLVPYMIEELKNEYLTRIEISKNNDLNLFFSSNKETKHHIVSMALRVRKLWILKKKQKYICLQGRSRAYCCLLGKLSMF